jgi:hypothetical protein
MRNPAKTNTPAYAEVWNDSGTKCKKHIPMMKEPPKDKIKLRLSIPRWPINTKAHPPSKVAASKIKVVRSMAGV